MAGEAPQASQVLERLEARRQAVQSFSMQGEINGASRQGELSGEHFIRGRYPDRLRAEVMGPFNKPVLLLVCDGVRLTVLAYNENKAYVGPASRRNLGRFLGLGLTPAEAYALLSGNLPLLRSPQARVFLSSEPGKAVLQLDERSGAQEGVIFSLGDYAVHEAWLAESGSGFGLSARFDSWQESPAGRFPKRIQLGDREGRSLNLLNDGLKINLPLDDAIFEASLPPQVEVQTLE